MNINKIKLNIGIEKPVHIAHLTDIHLCLADERDEDLIPHARGRSDVFRKESSMQEKSPEAFFREGMDYARDNCDLAVITGDIVDFISAANLDESDRILAGRDYMFTAGNHEFCPKVGIPDSPARRGDVYAEIQKHYRGNMFFESRVIHGLNLITMDNSYYRYSALQIRALEREIEKGLPILIFAHVPLTEKMLNPQKPEEAHRDLAPDRYIKEINNKMLDLIESCELIKAEFAGHWHVRVERVFRNRLPEYVTAGCFKGELTHIEIE